jgi:predicted nucleic acid-binding protein
LSGADLVEALDVFTADWERMIVVELDREIYSRAADIAITLGVRTLDALHLAAAQRAGAHALPFLTFDVRQANAARSLGWTVLGA